jgi:hypothetical protein
MTRTNIDSTNELNLITSIIVNDEAAKAFANIDRKLFQTFYVKQIYSLASDFYKQYGKACKGDIKKLYLNNIAEYEEEDNNNIGLFLKNLSKSYEENTNFEFSIDQGHEYLKMRTAQIFSEGLKDLVDNGEDTTAYIAAYKPYANESNLPKIDNADDLMKMELPPQKYLINGLIGWGIVMICGTHKIGKSFLMLQMALAISSGSLFMGKYKVKKREVIYMCLEDVKIRIQDRIKQMNLEDQVTNNLHFMYESRKGKDGLEDLSLILKQYPKTKCIIIDALATFRGMKHNRDIFQGDYDAIFEIKKWAIKNKVMVILVHHTRKPGKDGESDIVDSISGSQGLGAALDQYIIMKRPRKSQDGTFYSPPRDMEEFDLAIHFDLHNGGWEVLGNSDKVELSSARKRIIGIMEEYKDPMSQTQIAKIAECSQANVSGIINALIIDGYVKEVKVGYNRRFQIVP